MNINRINNNNIAFQKQLRAKCHILKNNRKDYGRIYELEESKPDDVKYFLRLLNDKSWNQGNSFLSSMNCTMKLKAEGKKKDEKIFVLENLKKECLGYCQITDNSYEFNLDFLETKPTYQGKGKKEYKYVGETIIAFLTSLCKREKREKFDISCALDDAVDFYMKKCFFDGKIRRDGCGKLKLDQDKFETMIKSNALHTKGKMRLK